MNKFAYIEREIVLIAELRKGDLFCPATDCLEQVWEGFDMDPDTVRTYRVPDLTVFEFIRLNNSGDVECRQIFPTTAGWHRLNTGRRPGDRHGNALDWRFRRVKLSDT
jgi:hypothetical protein